MTQGTSASVDLVRAAQRGDNRALEDLVAAHLPLVYNVIGRALNGRPDVDDLVQETMIQVVRGIGGLREPERFRSWVVAIAYRQIQMHLRGARRRPVLAGEVPDDLADPGGDFVERTITGLMLTGQRRELAEATRWLDDADRHLLALWWQEAAGELTRAELASALGVRGNHAAVRVQRMREHLDAARGLVRALHASPRCPELAEAARPWDGSADALWRKRLTRHVRGCRRCGALGTGLLAPEKLLPGIASLPAPVLAFDSLFAGAGKVSGLAHYVSTKAVVAATAAAVLAGGGIVLAVRDLPDTSGDAGIAAAAPPPTASPGARVAPSAPAPLNVPAAIVTDIYVAPNGDDAADGTLDHPFATLGKAVATVKPGQTISLRGGTYSLTAPIGINTSGDATHRITLTAYRDEKPVLDAAKVPADTWAVTQRAGFWTVRGLELKNARSHAWVCLACVRNVFQRLRLHDNGSSGLTLRDPGTAGNQVLDNDLYDNEGIGLGVKFGAGDGNLVRGNRAWGNGGDGFDLGDFATPVAVEYNWAFGNRNGFTLGGGSPPGRAAHTVRHNAAWSNRDNGFADGGNAGDLQLSNNTAYRNGTYGFSVRAATGTLRSNVAIGNDDSADRGAGVASSRNTWDEGTWSASMFRSVDATVAQGARAADGTLPRTDYLTTGNGMGASMSES